MARNGSRPGACYRVRLIEIPRRRGDQGTALEGTAVRPLHPSWCAEIPGPDKEGAVPKWEILAIRSEPAVPKGRSDT